jgi:hypothetical protein
VNSHGLGYQLRPAGVKLPQDFPRKLSRDGILCWLFVYETGGWGCLLVSPSTSQAKPKKKQQCDFRGRSVHRLTNSGAHVTSLAASAGARDYAEGFLIPPASPLCVRHAGPAPHLTTPPPGPTGPSTVHQPSWGGGGGAAQVLLLPACVCYLTHPTRNRRGTKGSWRATAHTSEPP